MKHTIHILAAYVALGMGSLASAQTGGGIIEGTVRDAQGLTMPGVTVTLSGAAVLGEQTTVTLDDGSYRFRALRPGTYDLRFEIQGFQTLNREGILVEGNRTFTINVVLQLATVAETVTVSGESPIVDVKTTALSNEFDEQTLHEVPSATDIWAVLGQTPGVRMRGYDVGGSHKSQQVSYESYGIRDQNRVLSEGVDSTEGVGFAGLYYDYYSIEEFTTSAAGADVEMTSPGSMVVMTVKSGGNEFSSLSNFDWEDDSFVSDNVTDESRARNFSGNPNLFFREFHTDLGGPIVKDRAWFYGFYNNFKIDKQISGVDPSISTDIGDFDQFGGKITMKLTGQDQFIGYSQWQLKEKPNRGLSLTTPPESVLAQDSWSWVHKAEWQRVWNDRTFSSVQFKHFGFGWPMVPQVDPNEKPSRIDTATGINSGAGFLGTSPPFTFVRWKPQITTTWNHYIPNMAGGSHDFKFGFDFQVDSSQFGSNSNSGLVRFFDNSALGRPFNVDEIAIYNMPQDGQVGADDRDMHSDLFVQDTWTISNRVTANLGVRYSRQRAYFKNAELQPFFSDFFPTGTIEGQTVTIWNDFAPRLGVTFDLTGNGKTVLKGHYGRYYVNIADQLSPSNPASFASITFKFLDQNQNGLFDGVQELGELVDTRGTVGQSLEGATGTPTNPDLKSSFADEFSATLEHELAPDTSVRFSYVRKQLRNDFGQFNRAQVLPLLDGRAVPYTTTCDGCPGEFAGTPLSLIRVPDELANAQDQVIDTFPDPFDEADYDNITAAFTRRFSQNFFLQGSFDYQWRDEPRSASGETQSPLNTDPLDITFFQNHNPSVDNLQDNTNWGARALARYELTAPTQLAVSGNIRHQSGFPWTPIHRVSVPGSGTQPILLDDIDNRRSENVTIVDLRVEKSLTLFDRYRITGMIDFLNLLNDSPETNFVLRTGPSFNDIIAALDPRAVKLAVRLEF